MAQPSETFERLRDHPFAADPEFANGLAIILGHPETPASEAEMNREDDLVLQAKCFFFSRKEKISPAIDFTAYKSWLTGQSTTATDVSGASPHEAAAAPRQPKYPASFAHIVELITTGQPIPGIEHIPDTVLTGYSTIGEKPQRRKPWERDDSSHAEGDATSNQPESAS